MRDWIISSPKTNASVRAGRSNSPAPMASAVAMAAAHKPAAPLALSPAPGSWRCDAIAIGVVRVVRRPRSRRPVSGVVVCSLLDASVEAQARVLGRRLDAARGLEGRSSPRRWGSCAARARTESRPCDLSLPLGSRVNGKAEAESTQATLALAARPTRAPDRGARVTRIEPGFASPSASATGPSTSAPGAPIGTMVRCASPGAAKPSSSVFSPATSSLEEPGFRPPRGALTFAVSTVLERQVLRLAEARAP